MNRVRGYSLIELMVAITLGLVLLAGVVQVFVNSKQGYQVQQSAGRSQENARFAVEYLNRYVTLADFWGTLKPSLNSGVITYTTARSTGGSGCSSATWIVDPTTGIKGYDGQSSASSFTDTTLGSCIGTVGTYVPNSDVLVVRYANPECYLPTGTVASASSSSSSGGGSGSSSGSGGSSSSGSATLTIANPPAAPAACSTASGIYWLRAQIGVNGTLFDITNSNDVSTAASAIGGNSADAPNGVLNYQYQTNVFFLAQADNGEGQTPTLYMGSLRNPTGTAQSAVQLYLQPLVDGVEMLKFEYGIDPNYGQANDTLSVSKYVPASSVTNWSQVLSVRASMIVRGDTLDNFTDTQNYQMTSGFSYVSGSSSSGGGSSSSGSASYAGYEKYQRRLIVKEIQLRNRVRGP